MDMDGRLTFINRSGAEMLGYSPQELLGQNMHALIHHSHARRLSLPRGRVAHFRQRKAGSSVACRQRCVLAERWKASAGRICSLPVGGRRPGTASLLPLPTLRNGAGWPDGGGGLATVSHELRTPLTSLRAALGLVASGALEKRPEKIRPMLDIALARCDRLVRLVNDIVDFERIEKGSLPLHKSEWNAIDFCGARWIRSKPACQGGIDFPHRRTAGGCLGGR